MEREHGEPLARASRYEIPVAKAPVTHSLVAMASPLAFCSNLLPQEHFNELIEALIPFATRVRTLLNWDCIGIDLRLGSQAIHEALNQTENLASIRSRLQDAGLVITTINGFPLSPFQTAVVKDQAYNPGWNDPSRLEDSIKLMEVSHKLCGPGAITMSTVPGSYRPWGPQYNDPQAIARSFCSWLEAATVFEQRHGRQVLLCPEPEPMCTFSSCTDLLHFITHSLLPMLVQQVESASKAQELLARHFSYCFDTCHAAVMFEDGEQAITKLGAMNIIPAKVQISAAPKITDCGNSTAIEALIAMQEPRFLHQTGIRFEHQNVLINDLPDLATTLSAHSALPLEICSHFHIPLNQAPATPGLESSMEASLPTIAAAQQAGALHLGVETYTWSILADDTIDAATGTAAELAWLAERMQP